LHFQILLTALGTRMLHYKSQPVRTSSQCQKMLTHKNVATTQIYAELVSEKKRETVDKISLK
jgi:hypothetical protein